MMKLSKFIPLLPRSRHTILAATVGVSAGEATEISAELERIDFNEYLTAGRDDVFQLALTAIRWKPKFFTAIG